MIRDDKQYVKMLETIVDTAYNGIVVVDKEEKIALMNDSYASFLELKKDAVIGKKVTEVIENTRLHIVLRTGESEIGHVQKIGEHNIVAMRSPIISDGKIVGAIGKIMFKDVEDVKFLADELKYYKNELKKERKSKYSFDKISDNNQVMKEIKKMAQKASKSNSTILVTGESGTGKEVFANCIHEESLRSLKPFIKMNCAAIPSELLESELFGYADGAFTGAKKGGKLGKFSLADGGTIFLDEIGDMPLSMQAKILRVLQEKEIEPVGGSKTQKVDVRVIAATNKDLRKLISENKFREDLYYRLNVIEIKLPPLKERKEDIRELTDSLFEKQKNLVGKYIIGIDEEVREVFENYRWPGNIRELENVIERALNLAEPGDKIKLKHLPKYMIGEGAKEKRGEYNLKVIVEEIEKNVIEECLEKFKGNKLKVAHELGISRSTLYDKIQKYKLD